MGTSIRAEIAERLCVLGAKIIVVETLQRRKFPSKEKPFLSSSKRPKKSITLEGKQIEKQHKRISSNDALKSRKEEYESLMEEMRPWYQETKQSQKKVGITPRVA